MSILEISSHRRSIGAWLLLPLLSMLLNVTDVAGGRPADEGKPIRVTNIEWRVEGDIVIISYDLQGPAGDSYEISVTLLNENDPSVRLIPKMVTGAVGKGRFAGTGREIRWRYTVDVPEGLTGGGYYFEVAAERVVGVSYWLYIAAGAAVAGGAAALLLGGKKPEDKAAPSVIELPLPPTRP